MITLIVKGICLIVKILFTLLKSIFPFISVPTQFAYCLGIILQCCTQANNFIYFIMGDTAFVIMPLLILLITYKYVAYPILSLIISPFLNKQG